MIIHGSVSKLKFARSYVGSLKIIYLREFRATEAADVIYIFHILVAGFVGFVHASDPKGSPGIVTPSIVMGSPEEVLGP
jgi:hypothetical protein